MNFKDYIGSWNGAKLLNRGLFLLLAVSLVSNVILSNELTAKNEKIIFKPLGEYGTLEVEQSAANLAYKKSWATTLATQLGNITPANVDLVSKTVEPLLSPEIYSCLKVEMDKQAIYLRKEALSMSYTPTMTKYEQETNRLFVSGDSETITTKGIPPAIGKRVFEMQLEVVNYRPVIKRMLSYFGDPRTSGWLAAHAKDTVAPVTTLTTNHCIDNEKFE